MVFRYFQLINEVRNLYNRNLISLNEEDIWLVESDLGKKVILENGDEVLELLHFVKMKDTALGIGEFDWWETDDISLTHIHKGLYDPSNLGIVTVK